MTSRKFLNLLLLVSMVASLLLWGGSPVTAQDSNPPGGNNPKMELMKALQGPLPANSNGEGHGNGQMRSMTAAERKAARLSQLPQQKTVSAIFAGLNWATAARSPLTNAAPGRITATGLTAATALATMAPPFSPPDYFGVANWANSPLPTIGSTGTSPTTVTVGNPLISRAYATDTTAPGALLGLFVVVPSAVLPAGTLQNFQTWNQASIGSGAYVSAREQFHAYLLRPAGGANRYMVVYDSGLLTVPALPAGNTTGQVATFPVAGSVTVQAGDVIGLYGAGVPLDIVTAGTDIWSYPAPTAPAQGSIITLGVDPGFPIVPQARTYSIAATVAIGTGTVAAISGGMRKFVDSLPPLCPAKNDLGQCLPVAVPDITKFPGSDYYEIELGQYNEQMHLDLPGPTNGGTGTLLRGYRQTNTTNPDASKFNYLGPVILAQKNRPVRVTFTNSLPTGAGGDLFIPTDTTYMGAGNGPDGTPYSENRATLHLHGGNTPWISDGTPHQWTAPGAEPAYNPTTKTGTNFKKGVSAASVPDMWFNAAGNLLSTCQGQPTCTTAGATNDPGAGKLTFYWPNQESGRFMFYHDHAYGITRLNVYAGEAGGYLLSDPAQENALAAATVPGTVGTTPDLAHIVPLVIQDKSFVPDNGEPGGQLAATDPTWPSPANPLPGKPGWGKGNLWFPHVYTPNQNPADVSGANAFGRWDYGPWFWPPQNPATLVSQPYACNSAAFPPGSPPAFPPLLCPGVPNPSGTPEGFLDTPVVNGTAYPYLTVDPAAYRFQILSAGNDRTWNLGLYVADPLSIAVTNGGSGYTAPPKVGLVGGGGSSTVVTATISGGSVTAFVVTGVGSGYNTVAPNVTIVGDGTGAAATAVINPLVGQVIAINPTSIGSGYTYATVAIDPPAGCVSGCITATATAAVTPRGSVLGVTVSPGTVWTSAPTVSFSGGGGTGAAAIASVNTEVKMVDAAPHTRTSPLPLCNSATPTSGAMLALATLDASGNPLNGTGLPANCWPTSWPTDGRDGGVPDPATAGPPFVQIGTEGGLLPAAAVIPSTPVNYEYNRRSITVLNIWTHGLLMGPAERADVVVDFSKFAGKTLILYNDAPAPVPAFDPRSDYYTGSPDQTLSGGAPSTLPGYGPNTRTIMQIRVKATGAANGFTLKTLTTQLPGIFAATQDKIIMPEPGYPAANGGGGPNYARIQDNSITTWTGGPVGSITLTSGGTGYTAVPTVIIAAPPAGGTQATATATLTPAGVASVNLSNTGGFGYTSAPAVSFSGGGGTGAAATAVLGNSGVRTITIGSGGAGYTSAATVNIGPPNGPGCPTGCVQATATATRGTIFPWRLTNANISITNPGAGYSTAPPVTITGGGGSGATATAALGSRVVSFTLTNGGNNYTSAPTVTVAAPPSANCRPAAICTAATATATWASRAVASITLTNGGTGYTSAPTVSFSGGGGGTGAAATATAPVMPLLPKTIQELFTLDYGRMNATLGVELPFTNFLTQTTIPYGYIDPPTEIFKDGETQIWKITHNGVDTHFVHFHLFTVQVLNRVGWDGAIKPPDLNELSWKDTVRMNPLEDIVVALRPMKQQKIAATDLDVSNLPNSIRPLDVTQPVGSVLGFTNVDPTNQPAPVTNDRTNFGWEYVWHCHILGHEENDMMRAMVLAVPPRVPGTPVATRSGSGTSQSIVVTWADNSANETGFTIQRSTNGGAWTTVGTVGPNVTTFTNTGLTTATTYSYRVIANNMVGYTRAYVAPAVGYPHVSADSAPTAPSNAVTTL